MEATNHTVTLANGKQVPWEEFSTWSIYKQNGSLNPTFGSKPQAWSKDRNLRMSKLQKESFKNGRTLTRNFGSQNPSSKPVMTPEGEFPSRRAAAAHFGVRSRVMYNWIRVKKPDDFFYVSEKILAPQHIHIGMRSVQTPDGTFESIQAAAIFYEVTPFTIKSWIKHKSDAGFSYFESGKRNGFLPGSKSVMTPSGIFPSLISAARHYDVQSSTIKRWVLDELRNDFYFLDL